MENIIKGMEYEKFINNYINTFENVKKSYLWKDVPEYVLFDYNFISNYLENRLKKHENPLQDIGTDIIYIDNDDKCIIVQCKNYTTNYITIQNLAGFFFIMTKHYDKNGEVYYNNKISPTIKKSFINHPQIKLIHKPFIQVNETHKFELYDYQKNVIDLAKEFYINNKSGILSLPCGTGKTLISCYIGMNYKIVIMITPLKEYARQNIDRYNIYENDRQCILIDSDGTRDIDDIKQFINDNNKVFISATYKSCDIINLLDFNDDYFVIFDEFHNFSYKNIYDDNDNINKLIYNNTIKKLYLSATPRIYELENNDDIDVEDLFEKYIYKMSFNEAITNKYISDYKLYLPIFSNENNQEINKLYINKDYILKLQFLIEAIKMLGTLKMIIYLKCHEEIELFIKNFNKMNEYYKYDVDIDNITCNDSYNKRKKILKKFNESEKISLLLSVHILDEAIDIPSCDSIYMTYVSKSKIKNIQRMSRAMRYKHNKIANIFLYCLSSDSALDYISSIREYDTDFITKINHIEVSDEIKDISYRDKINIEYNDKIKVLGIQLYKTEKWQNTFNKVKEYIDKNKELPTRHNIDNNIKNIGVWLNNQRQYYKNKINIMKNLEIYNIWTQFMSDYNSYFIDNDTLWFTSLNKVITYIEKNKQKPNKRSDDEEIKYLGDWVNHQFQNYKNKSRCMNNEIIYNKWTEFIESYGKYYLDNNTIWYNTLFELKEFLDKNNKIPQFRSLDENTKKLGNWLNHNIQNYKNRYGIMDNDEIRDEWNKFIKEYNKFFEDEITSWNNNFIELEIYIDKYKKKPNRSATCTNKKLGSWFETQMKNFNNKSQLMKNEEIYNKWKEFIKNKNL
jgi:superfamily II DNA or RNA helicase